MKLLATFVLSIALALPAAAAVVHDEAVNGDLSSDPLVPTPIAFAIGGNTIIGTCGNLGSPVDIRDYIRFTIPAGQRLTALNLVAYDPDNLSFLSFNTGTESQIPSGATSAFFLAGIHIAAAQIGTDLMPLFVSSSLTTHSLPQPELGPGDYCFLIQQTSPITQGYTLEFVLDVGTPTQGTTWGTIKSLYR
jgi:hypothetical protein